MHMTRKKNRRNFSSLKVTVIMMIAFAVILGGINVSRCVPGHEHQVKDADTIQWLEETSEKSKSSKKLEKTKALIRRDYGLEEDAEVVFWLENTGFKGFCLRVYKRVAPGEWSYWDDTYKSCRLSGELKSQLELFELRT